MTSIKTVNTYDLSEDDKSQITIRNSSKVHSKPEQVKRTTQALEVNIDEESEEDEDNSLSNHAASPLSRFGWRKQEISNNLQESQEKPMTKLSRKPHKTITSSNEEDKKELTDTIEVSDFESSANSFGAYSYGKSEVFNNTAEAARNIEQKLRNKPNPTSLESINEEQKKDIL
eukprot:CAMPEP_0205802860 /NCGR_PEP_ID=MMETSP0205-20121125/5334_1 /ASSEMBLY_ACC=CAM_ASM_000278 /TAXON_ID=36767 /ORGANISM="Euplotes focardii, Strain TN1" /LENGTH=172 /DNA_ID=CAMNT_0053070001 /DNA_START=146 /DNA_END=661 /DNA_ORIENTATION=-